jgi:hypothetical protein
VPSLTAGTLYEGKYPLATALNAIIAMVKRFIYKTFFGCYKKEIKIYLIGENLMGLKYRVYLPELGASDVVSREVSLSVDGEDSILQVSADNPFVDLPVLLEGVVVSLAVRDTDDAGNVSDWSEVYTFYTRDTIRPRYTLFPQETLLDQGDRDLLK